MFQLARLVDERMAKRHLVLSEGGVAQMPKEYPFLLFAAKITKVVFILFVFFVAESFSDRPKHIGKRGGGSGLGDPVRGFARFWIGGKNCRARPVLTTIVLLFHEKRQFRSTEIGGRAVAPRPPQDHHRHSTFVFYFIGHQKKISTTRAN